MPTSTKDQNQPESTHYTILSLPTTPPPTAQILKLAYRRTLLLHHPDKSPSTPSPKYSIDSITLAYRTLSSPTLRAAYDRSLAFHPGNPTNSTSSPAEPQHPGLETVDLEDMKYAPGDSAEGEEEGEGEGRDGGLYWRGCRCGRPMAYEIPEKELEVWAEDGEVLVQCQGCSLWLRVLFAVVEEEDER